MSYGELCPILEEMRFSPGLQGLRGLAILLVVACHVQVLPGGWVGVDLFFALSGFLITGLLLDRPRLGDFYMRRARRLIPALVLLIAGVLLIEAAVFWQRLPLATLLGAGTYTMNFLRFDGDSYTPLGHLWSLAQEEQFYLVWPLLLYAVAPRRRLALAVALALLVILRLDALADSGASVNRLYFGPDTHALPLLLGCCLALVPRPPALTARCLGAAGAFGLALVSVGAALPTLTAAEYARFEIVAALAGICLVIAALHDPFVLRNRVLQRLGLYSYGIYLWHGCLIVWLPDVLAVPLTLILAVMSYHLIERPIRSGGWPGSPVLRPSPAAHGA